ncbi:BTB/POZ domain-containing protein FBL11 isoform X34 [Quercus robur]|nr:BTB/POZ domain-containing protein FBL11 isoform X34 [Quercus robur]
MDLEFIAANDFLPELCASFLARNFMWAMSSKLFGDVPYHLLLSCIEHPHLTVDSEMHLSDALLVWVDANAKQLENFILTSKDCHGIFRQIRVSLLPLWFAAGMLNFLDVFLKALEDIYSYSSSNSLMIQVDWFHNSGKRRSCHFSELSKESVDSIFKLMSVPPINSMNGLGDSDLHNLRVRLTEYSKKVNLSGCPQITLAIFLLSLLPSSYSIDPTLRKSVKNFTMNFGRLEREQCPISQGLPMLSFESVQEVDISKCPRLHLEAAITCFSKSFPSIRTLKAAYLLNFKTTTLHQLVQKCPLLCEVDLTIDISPLIPAQVSVASSSAAIAPLLSNKSVSVRQHPEDDLSIKKSGLLLSNITKLTLEGRTDLCDLDLQYISKFCPSLHDLNLKGCISVTDVGISNLICNCMKLHSIVVCDTSFGENSVLALCSGISSNYGNSSADDLGWNCNSLISNLQKLHIGGCKSVDETSLLELLSQTKMLKSLCLRDTQLVDQALHCFSGSSLEMLDISNTMVSAAALAHLVHGNPGLKCLNARGCSNIFQHESNTSGGENYYLYKDLYLELGNCKLEEISLGWGFSYLSLEALQPAIMSLRSITVGLGGSLSEDALKRLPAACPMLESVILHFQVISDTVIMNILAYLRNLRVLALCYCLGDISMLSFSLSMQNLRKLRLERVTPWMTNNDLVILTQNCANLVELSLLGCKLLNSDSQKIISHGCPGLISIHLEECGEVTANGVSSLLDCAAIEDLLLRHNGPGIQKTFIFDAASKLPMLRKISLDVCDASEGDFDIPDNAERCFLSTVKIARCKSQRCNFNLSAHRTPVHEETLGAGGKTLKIDTDMEPPLNNLVRSH